MYLPFRDTTNLGCGVCKSSDISKFSRGGTSPLPFFFLMRMLDILIRARLNAAIADPLRATHLSLTSTITRLALIGIVPVAGFGVSRWGLSALVLFGVATYLLLFGMPLDRLRKT